MIITNEQDKAKIIADEPFYCKERNTFCLGNSLEEAGKVFQKMLQDNAEFISLMNSKSKQEADAEQ